MHTQKAPGEVQELGAFGSGELALLHSFEIDEYRLGTAHRHWLRQVFRQRRAPARTETHVWVVGLASRTASFSHNHSLSRRRAAAVVDELRSTLGDRVRVSPFSLCGGVLVAGLRGVPDGTERPGDRAVLVAWWRTPAGASPPPPPRPRLHPHQATYSIWSIQLQELAIDRSESIGYGVIPQVSTNRIRARFRIRREPQPVMYEYAFNLDDGLKIDAPGVGPPMGTIREAHPKAFEKVLGKEFPPSKWIPFTDGFGKRGASNPIHESRCMFRTKDTFGNVELRFGGPTSEKLWRAGRQLRMARPAIPFRFGAEFDYAPSGPLGEEFFLGTLQRMRLQHR